ncbi:MAG TPA: sigma factor G inhibitor Gin [Bacillus sp. (in: firmicutes)]|nr:sigma factor G inhibitor Gin [Bacillus sp. (in: firmicutes)]
MICDELKEDGVQIHHHFICTQCEQEMVSLTVNTDLYSYFIQKLKKLSF